MGGRGETKQSEASWGWLRVTILQLCSDVKQTGEINLGLKLDHKMLPVGNFCFKNICTESSIEQSKARGIGMEGFQWAQKKDEKEFPFLKRYSV